MLIRWQFECVGEKDLQERDTFEAELSGQRRQVPMTMLGDLAQKGLEIISRMNEQGQQTTLPELPEFPFKQ